MQIGNCISIMRDASFVVGRPHERLCISPYDIMTGTNSRCKSVPRAAMRRDRLPPIG